MSSNVNNIAQFEYRKKKNRDEMKIQVVSFSLMILLTFVSFGAVLFEDVISKWFSVPFIILLAFVQVIFQLYYFMHMKHKGHGVAQVTIFTGLFIAMISVLALVTIVWW
ncbi:MAG: cytochrome c oxidase subunit IVB [Bacilli bacterium]